MTLEEMIKDAGLEPKTINKVIKDFQKGVLYMVFSIWYAVFSFFG